MGLHDIDYQIFGSILGSRKLPHFDGCSTLVLDVRDLLRILSIQSPVWRVQRILACLGGGKAIRVLGSGSGYDELKAPQIENRFSSLFCVARPAPQRTIGREGGRLCRLLHQGCQCCVRKQSPML